MRIAIFGATGEIGSRTVQEALDRGHDVTAIVRSRKSAASLPEAVETSVADATDARAVATAVAGHDAVVSAVGGARKGHAAVVVEAAHALIEGLEAAGVKRLLVVGGAGSLVDANGVRLIDGPTFNPAWRASSEAQIEALAVYREHAGGLDWTYLSPADVILPGGRTGQFTLGGDEVVVDASGKSFISMEDYAVALLDELETPAHIGRRFTVAYS